MGRGERARGRKEDKDGLQREGGSEARRHGGTEGGPRRHRRCGPSPPITPPSLSRPSRSRPFPAQARKEEQRDGGSPGDAGRDGGTNL
jgi:hypothetical protein